MPQAVEAAEATGDPDKKEAAEAAQEAAQTAADAAKEAADDANTNGIAKAITVTVK